MVAILFSTQKSKKTHFMKAHHKFKSTLYEVLAMNEQYLYSLGYRHLNVRSFQTDPLYTRFLSYFESFTPLFSPPLLSTIYATTSRNFLGL